MIEEDSSTTISEGLTREKAWGEEKVQRLAVAICCGLPEETYTQIPLAIVNRAKKKLKRDPNNLTARLFEHQLTFDKDKVKHARDVADRIKRNQLLYETVKKKYGYLFASEDTTTERVIVHIRDTPAMQSSIYPFKVEIEEIDRERKNLAHRKADEILNYIKDDKPLQEIENYQDLDDRTKLYDERVRRLDDLPTLFREMGNKRVGSLLERHLHRVLLTAINRRDNQTLKRIALSISNYRDIGLDKIGLNESAQYELYRAGIVGWDHYPGSEDGIFSLFQFPHSNSEETITHLDKKVRYKFPDFSSTIDRIIDWAKKYR